MKNKILAILAVLAAAAPLTAGAIPITAGIDVAIRVDFQFAPSANYFLPIYVVDHTVHFGSGADALNLGEAYEIRTYDENEVLLGGDSYLNESYANIIGCACTGGYLDVPLSTYGGFLILTALQGSFDVTDVFVVGLARRNAGGAIGAMINIGNATITNVRACSEFPGGGATDGCFPGSGPFPGRGVPEPGTLGLLGLGLIGLSFSRRRKLN